MQKLTNNQLKKLANIERVQKNMAAGMDVRTAVKAAYPNWSEERVSKYINEMQI